MEQAGSLVAERFLVEFERAIKFIVENSGIGMPYARNRKAYHLRGFPYSVIYRNIESTIFVFVVLHQRRMPNFGNKRRSQRRIANTSRPTLGRANSKHEAPFHSASCSLPRS